MDVSAGLTPTTPKRKTENELRKSGESSERRRRRRRRRADMQTKTAEKQKQRQPKEEKRAFPNTTHGIIPAACPVRAYTYRRRYIYLCYVYISVFCMLYNTHSFIVRERVSLYYIAPSFQLLRIYAYRCANGPSLTTRETDSVPK